MSEEAKPTENEKKEQTTFEAELKIRGVNHAEAFCLMQYQDEVTGETEILWNSRDGVTPFLITSWKGNTSKHVRWNQDIYAPNHTPNLNDRVFVDMTIERAREHRKKFVEEYWEKEICGIRMCESYADHTKEEVVEQLAQSDVGEGGNPDIIVVDEKFLENLKKSRKGDSNDNSSVD